MSRTEDFDNAFWTDPDVEVLSPEATWLYVWSWTNLRCGMAGLYRVSLRAMTESKVPLERIPAALEELAAGDFAYFEDNVLWVRSRVKRIRSKTRQIGTAVAKDVEKVPAGHPLRRRFLDYYGSEAWLSEALMNLTRASSEAHETPHSDEESLNLTRASSEPHPRFLGRGLGQGQGTEPQKTPVAREASPDVTRLCSLLADLIRQRDPKAKVQPDSKRWHDAMRLLITDRQGDIAEVERILRWSQADSFWQPNILCPTKLREKFTTLLGQSTTRPGGGHLRPVAQQQPTTFGRDLSRFDHLQGGSA